MAVQTTTPNGHADGPKYAYLLKQYDGLQDLHRGRTAEQRKSLPAVVHPNIQGTWAYDTVHRRLREEILKRVYEENAEYLRENPGTLQRIHELDREMRALLKAPLRKLRPSRTASSTCSATAARLSPAPTAANGAAAQGQVSQEEEGAAAVTNGTRCEISGRQQEESSEGRYYPVEVELADLHCWNDVVLQRDVPAGATWASAPWLVSELYFYRRLAEAFSHFENGYDFFGKQKRASLAESTGLLLGYAEAARCLRKKNSNIGDKKQSETAPPLPATRGTAQGANISGGGASLSAAEERLKGGREQQGGHRCLATLERDLRSALLGSLSGNAADLSLWPVNSEGEAEDHATRSSSKPLADPEDSSCILCDDTSQFIADILAEREQHEKKQQGGKEKQQKLQEEKASKLAGVPNGGNAVNEDGETSKEKKTTAFFFLDNAGSELLSDLWLACVLIEHAVVQKVVFFTKQYPIFVSDALPADIEYTLQWVRQHPTPQYPAAVQELAQLWNSYVTEGKWEVKPHVYFSMPYEYSDMPRDLYNELKENAAFVISKGDANYRRIMGDRKWPLQTPFSEVASYFPAPLLALRRLKADIACGIPLEQQQRAEQEDPSWMVNVTLATMNGCTKRKTHRLLRPFLELQQQFPKIPHWQGADILRRLKQKEHDVDPVHPCMDTWGEYVQCLRRYGNGAVTKCKIEDARHARCLQQHGTWKPSDTLQAEKLLEMMCLSFRRETPAREAQRFFGGLCPPTAITVSAEPIVAKQ